MRAGKLFHAIVVVGASLTGGCGAATEPEDEDAGALADAAVLDAAVADASPTDAGAEDDGMVLIL